MTEREFLEKYRSDKPMFEAWGVLVKTTLEAAIMSRLQQLGDVRTSSVFIKVPISPRVKEESSIIEKVFIRKVGKYKNPYEDIKDKVGLRIVVLLLSDIKIVCEIIESTTIWEASKDKDFEQQRSTEPDKFGYESVHYITSCRHPQVHNGKTIIGGTPCEIQVRTLLQHAHSELTHDRVYKAKIEANTKVKRTVAKSMALIEAVDDYFEMVDGEMSKVVLNQDSFLNSLSKLFYEVMPSAKPFYNERMNTYLYDGLEDLVEKVQVTLPKLKSFVDSKSFVISRIDSRKEWDLLAPQPISLLIYFLAENARQQLEHDWPLPLDKLETYIVDLGL